MRRPFPAAIHPDKRSLQNLGTKLEKCLLAYASVAAASGVTMLAATQPASAEIVYRQVNIHVNGLRTIDLNNDGIKDFIFGMNSTSRYGARFLFVQHAHPIDSIAVTSGSNPVPLHPGNKIGPSGRFVGGSKGLILAVCSVSCPPLSSGASHSWLYSTSFMGVRFSVNGETHYGWIRLKVPNILLSVTEIISYAYETTPDTPIIAGQISGNDALGRAAFENSQAPEPATLGRLAQGATGIAAWRKPAQRSKPGSVK